MAGVTLVLAVWTAIARWISGPLQQEDAGGGFSPIVLVIMLVVIAIEIAALWRVFEKAGEPGWAAIIPIYNTIVLLRIAGKPVWWILLLLIPFLNVVILLMVAIDLAKAFGKSPVFGVIMLWLLNVIGYPLLGFGDARYTRPAAG